jgi:1,4-alpha-glucan branching enzyme
MSALDQIELPAARGAPDQPISIYEVHLPSWRRVPEEQNRPLTASEIAPQLADYVNYMNFTHVQFRSPGDPEPQELGFLTDFLRRRNVGVILETSQPFNSPADGQCVDGKTLLAGYGYQWNTMWAEELTAYLGLDPLRRKSHQGQFTRRDSYSLSANYILPLSHQLVTRPRPSLLTSMPGDEWQKFANLRLLFAYLYLFPGKKLVFMGNEFGQQNSWRPGTSLDWHLIGETNFHGKLGNWVATLNRCCRGEPALHQTDSASGGFQWVDTSDAASSVISFLRRDADGREALLAVFNFTPMPRHNYRVGAPKGGFWTEKLNSDAVEFGGSGQGNLGGVEAAPFGWNFQSHSLMLTLPPLAAILLKAPA